MTSRSVLRCLTPRLPALSVGSVFCSMPLGRITGRPVTPLSLAISARSSATVCFNSAFSASRRSVRASRSPRDRPERGIFSGTDMPGTNRVRKARMQPHSISYLPGFLPQVLLMSAIPRTFLFNNVRVTSSLCPRYPVQKNVSTNTSTRHLRKVIDNCPILAGFIHTVRVTSTNVRDTSTNLSF